MEVIILKCKICSNNVDIIDDLQLEYKYQICKNCNFIYRLEKYHLEENEEFDFYSKHKNSIEEESYRNYLSKFIDEAIFPFIKSGDALDFGCGPGPVLAHILEKNGFNCSIYDKNFYNNDDNINKKYDLIVSTEVFEHFVNPLEEITKLTSLLNKNGIISIMTMFRPSIEEFHNWWYRRDYTHISFYDLKTFDYIKEKFNLRELYTNNKNIIVLQKI